MRPRLLPIFFPMLLLAASCSGAAQDRASATDPASPAKTTVASTETLCGVENPSDGPSITDIRLGLTDFYLSEDLDAVVNTYTTFPDIPVAVDARFTGYETSMTNKNDGQTSFFSTLYYNVSETQDEFVARYEAFAKEIGWTSDILMIEGVVSATLTDPATKDEIKISYTQRFDLLAEEIPEKRPGALSIDVASSGETAVIESSSHWYQWHIEEFPYVEGGCYRGGGVSTFGFWPPFHIDDGNTHTLSVKLTYPGMTKEAFVNAMTANAEAAGFTVEPGAEDDEYELTKADYSMKYFVGDDSDDGLAVNASGFYPIS